MLRALQRHWPEYLIEAVGLGAFMVSASLFATILEHPSSPLHQALPWPLLRRFLMGVAMGSTAIMIVYSPWGKRSGAHINPAFTLSFLRLHKIAPWDALFYIAAQFVGGIAGIGLVYLVVGSALTNPNVNSVVTVPGTGGPWLAFFAEVIIAFILMLTVLVFSNQPRLNRYTGLVVALLLATYITLEAPISGTSLNPARSFASALVAWLWSGLWIYFTAPVIGMLCAVEAYQRWPGTQRVLCAKLHHDNSQPCIFRCDYPKHTNQVTHV